DRWEIASHRQSPGIDPWVNPVALPARTVPNAGAGGALPRPFLKQDDTDGRYQDQKIEEEAAVLHVIEIIRQLLPRVLDRCPIGEVYLCPTGDPGLDVGAVTIKRDIARQFFDEVRPLRARTDEAHLTAQHVDELRQFVDPCRADESTHAGDSRVVARGPTRLALRLGIGPHAAKLQ